MITCKRGWRDTRPDDRIASTERPAQVVVKCVEQHGHHWKDPPCSFPSEGLVPAHTGFSSCSTYSLFSPCIPAPLPTEAASRKEILPSRTYYSDPEDADVLKENEANAFSVRS